MIYRFLGLYNQLVWTQIFSTEASNSCIHHKIIKIESKLLKTGCRIVGIKLGPVFGAEVLQELEVGVRNCGDKVMTHQHCSTEGDGRVKQIVILAQRRQNMGMNTDSSSTLSSNCDSVGISTKVGNVLLDPSESQQLVLETLVTSSEGSLQSHEAHGTQPVVDGDHHQA